MNDEDRSARSAENASPNEVPTERYAAVHPPIDSEVGDGRPIEGAPTRVVSAVVPAEARRSEPPPTVKRKRPKHVPSTKATDRYRVVLAPGEGVAATPAPGMPSRRPRVRARSFKRPPEAGGRDRAELRVLRSEELTAEPADSRRPTEVKMTAIGARADPTLRTRAVGSSPFVRIGLALFVAFAVVALAFAMRR